MYEDERSGIRMNMWSKFRECILRPRFSRTVQIVLASVYILSLGLLSYMCSIKPVEGDFDRYIYEAIVRGKIQQVQEIYPLIKHESPRAEASTVLDSPDHLAKLEPLYAIRPLYIEAITLARLVSPTIQRAISLVSALSLFGVGIILLAWVRRPFYCALLMASPAITGTGRLGTPDALSALFILAAVWMLMKSRFLSAITFLLLSVWIRTDNLLFVLAILGWQAFRRNLKLSYLFTLASIAIASVLVINHFSGNYGWEILFRYSFLAGRSPAEIAPHLHAIEYLSALFHGLTEVGGQELALWTLVGIGAWHILPQSSPYRALLLTVSTAAVLRFALFPSPEDRYFMWAYLIVGVAFIEGIHSRKKLKLTSPESKRDIFLDHPHRTKIAG